MDRFLEPERGRAVLRDLFQALRGRAQHRRGAFAAIGAGTAAKIREYPLAVDLVPKVSTAEGLLNALLKSEGGVENRTILVVRPDEARKVLTEGLTGPGPSSMTASPTEQSQRPPMRRGAGALPCRGRRRVDLRQRQRRRTLRRPRPPHPATYQDRQHRPDHQPGAARPRPALDAEAALTTSPASSPPSEGYSANLRNNAGRTALPACPRFTRSLHERVGSRRRSFWWNADSLEGLSSRGTLHFTSSRPARRASRAPPRPGRPCPQYHGRRQDTPCI